MNWPEALLGIVGMVATLIYLACTRWYWGSND